MLKKLVGLLKLRGHTHHWQPVEREFLEVCSLCGVTRWVLTVREYEGYPSEEDSD